MAGRSLCSREHLMRFVSDSEFSLQRMRSALIACCLVAFVPVEAALAFRSIPLEIIVKFADDSDAGRRVERILREHPQDLNALAELRDRLHRSPPATS